MRVRVDVTAKAKAAGGRRGRAPAGRASREPPPGTRRLAPDARGGPRRQLLS